MRSIIIIFSSEIDFPSMEKAYGVVGTTSRYSPCRLIAEGEWGWFAIGVESSLESEFSPTDRDFVNSRIESPIYAQLEYSNANALKLALDFMPTTSGTLVDDDHGSIISLEDARLLLT